MCFHIDLSASMPDLPIYHTLTNIYTAVYELVPWYTLMCSDSYMPTNLYSASSLHTYIPVSCILIFVCFPLSSIVKTFLCCIDDTLN